MNNNIIHVDPHITQYTVYITDNYTGNIIVKENVTETQYTFIHSDDGARQMYHISAWNAGGESERSACITHSKSPILLPYSENKPLYKLGFLCLYSSSQGNSCCTYSIVSQVLRLHVNVSFQFELGICIVK